MRNHKNKKPLQNDKNIFEPLISVVVPVYNSSEHLQKCLCSILSQSYRNIEVIAVNDGSTDGSLDILLDIQQKDSRVIVLNQENSGGICARKNGIQRAKGEYILLEDSDDWLENKLIEKCVYTIKKHRNIDIVKFGYISEPSKKRVNPVVNGAIKNGVLEGEENDQVLKRLLYYSDCNNVWNEMVRKSLYDFDNSIFEHIVHKGEDVQINLQIWQKARRTFFLKECLYHYNTENLNGITKGSNAHKVVRDVRDSIYLNSVKKAVALKKFNCVDNKALANRTMDLLSDRMIYILAFNKKPKNDIIYIQNELKDELRSFLGDNFKKSDLDQSFIKRWISANIIDGRYLNNLKYKTICKCFMKVKRKK